MPAFVVAFVEIHDQDTYRDEYMPKLLETLAEYDAKVLVSTESVVVLEPPWPTGRTVILEFPNIDRARLWYQSDKYSRLIELRLRIASSSLALVQGR